MTHLPLTLGEYRAAAGPVIVAHIGKHGKWAFGPYGMGKWRVATGEHGSDPDLDIIARHDPDAELALAKISQWSPHEYGSPESKAWIAGSISGMQAAEAANRDHWRQEIGKLHSQQDRVKAERDEAAAALAFYADASRYKIECQLSPLSYRTARLTTTFPEDGVFKDGGQIARDFLIKIGGR